MSCGLSRCRAPCAVSYVVVGYLGTKRGCDCDCDSRAVECQLQCEMLPYKMPRVNMQNTCHENSTANGKWRRRQRRRRQLPQRQIELQPQAVAVHCGCGCGCTIDVASRRKQVRQATNQRILALVS
ncbi:hypothetical protein M5D96_007620 [Drosophila gunungcola]|uniref:Uncharacterized protein n=1 Tax=Drosophila gunungcola TaxID=103775 RepID=A0A9Q0BQL7_9MUSC|nr:hypothetical protein M5D96_007620 [Drosophila gunungcola]